MLYMSIRVKLIVPSGLDHPFQGGVTNDTSIEDSMRTRLLTFYDYLVVLATGGLLQRPACEA